MRLVCTCCTTLIPNQSISSDLGAHIDGFIAVVAHTVVVGGVEATGRAADVVLAAHYASEAALRLLRPGNEVSYF